MYNQELKQRFIDQLADKPGMKNAYAVAFNACEEFEKEWGADLCTRSAEELQPMMEKLCGMREYGRKIRLATMADYVRWCIDNGVDGACDGLMHVDVTGVGKMKTYTVRSPLHLQTYLNSVFDAEGEKTVDNVYRCYYWLAYSGMSEEDALRVKASDVDLSEMLVRFGDEEFPIYREAIQSIKNCVKMSQFMYKHPQYEIWKDRADGDALVRGFRSQPSPIQMRVELSRHAKEALKNNRTDLKLSFYRIWISGVFYRVYERELAGFPPDFTAVAAKTMQGKTYVMKPGGYSVGSYMRKLKKRYLTDYENWKKTLSP